MADQNGVGNTLGDSGLYLQHPSAVEYDRLVPYHNPHYLLRPGSQMPELDALSLGDSGEATKQTLLQESAKGRFMRLFDETGDSGVHSGKVEVEPSPRLRSTLKE